jgi:hypothetical protein
MRTANTMQSVAVSRRAASDQLEPTVHIRIGQRICGGMAMIQPAQAWLEPATGKRVARGVVYHLRPVS